MDVPTIAILDDHPAIVESVTAALSDDFKVLWGSNTATDFLDKVDTESELPELAVVDVVLEDTKGITFFAELQKRAPQIKVIAYSSLGSPILVTNLIERGVQGYVNKREPIENLQEACKAVLDGDMFLPEEYSFLLSKYRIQEKTVLSPREVEILNLIVNESTSKEIAEKLDLSLNTVENHRKKIFEKLGVKNLAGMVVEAMRQGYIS